MEYLIRGGMSGRDLFFNHPGWMTNFRGTIHTEEEIDKVKKLLEAESK